MLILAISDIHGAFDRAAALPRSCRDADLVLLAGDLTDYGGAAEAGRALEALGWARGKLAVVPGNCDKRAARAAIEEAGVSADGKLVELGGVLVAGSGGSQLRTGLAPYERRDRDIADSLRAGLALANGVGEKPLAALTHTPPKDSGADCRRGSGHGSPALREVLDSTSPVLRVCGHIHESPCARLAGRTLVVNPGAVHDGRYALIRLERDGDDGSWQAAAELHRDA